MAKEPDQTRWVGIRPTDPSENIPVTESDPLTDILVAPSAGDPEFLTLTKKRAPAISDLQAIKDNIGNHVTAAGQDCSVSKSLGSGTVEAADIWVITNMVIYNEVSMCDMIMKANTHGVVRVIKQFCAYEKNCYGVWTGLLVLIVGDSLSFEWLLGGATDDIFALWQGYKIGVY